MPMAQSRIELTLPDAEATDALGAALARGLRCGLRGGDGAGGAVIYLRGELGAGKTTCVRSLLRTLGVSGLIRSPTYTLLESYQPAGLTCIHIDLYRLGAAAEVDELGLRDYLDADCLMLVEWPERGAEALPAADLDLTWSYLGSARRVRIDAPTARGACLQDMLLHDTSLTSYVSNSA
jgi:tRNA threonylcarbamoyladenosine biosynthesis protein TsaE